MGLFPWYIRIAVPGLRIRPASRAHCHSVVTLTRCSAARSRRYAPSRRTARPDASLRGDTFVTSLERTANRDARDRVNACDVAAPGSLLSGALRASGGASCWFGTATSPSYWLPSFQVAVSGAPFRTHWEHGNGRRLAWYICAAPPEELRPWEGRCDAPALKEHQLAHRPELCRCGFVSYRGAKEADTRHRAEDDRRRSPEGKRRLVRIPDKVKGAVRLRARNRCEDCQRPLAVTRRIPHPAVWADARVRVFDDYPCWKCHRPCTAVQIEFGDQEIDIWPNDDEIGRAVSQMFPTFFWDYSRTVQGHYWANHCLRCGALQGGFPVSEYGKPGRIVLLPGFRRRVQEAYTDTRTTQWGHFHHRDGNPANNALDNIALLCVRCHDSRHRETPPSRRQSDW